MKKTILLSSLIVLAIFSIVSFSVASSGQSAIPIWTDCRGAHTHGNIEIGAAVGQNTIVVSWTSPPSDWIKDISCQPYPFTQSEMTVYVSSAGITPSPTTVICHSTSCADGFALLHIVKYCVGHTCIGKTVPYALKYNDHVYAEVTTTYAGYEEHFGSYTLSVTS